MPTRSLSQTSFFDPAFLMPECLEPATVPWLLGTLGSSLFPAWLAGEWRGSGRRGRKAWPAPVLTALLVLRWSEEGMSRVACVRRAEVDVRWRAAMGLRVGAPTPSERTLRDFEAFLREYDARVGTTRVVVLHEHLVRLCLSEGVAPDPQWAADSTPMWCYGAVQDTVRLLGDGLTRAGRWYARATTLTHKEVARAWKLPLLLSKSTKGHYRIDWRDPDARAKVVTELAEAAVRVAESVEGTPDIQKSREGREALRLCRCLVRVVEQDLEQDPQGRMVIAQRVAENRLVSLTDPSARHGRKTRSVSFEGFKLHVLGDFASGLITAVRVAPANVADNAPMHRLVAASRRAGAVMDRLLADTAYGSGRDRVKLRENGVRLVAPVPMRSSPGDRLTKDAFVLDFDARTATCPNGVTTSKATQVKAERPDERSTVFHWPSAGCSTCPLQARCCEKGKNNKRLQLHPHERELRTVKEEWSREQTRDEYRPRAQFERLNHQLTRHGARKARAWGLASATLQAHAIAIRCNLQLLAERYAERAP